MSPNKLFLWLQLVGQLSSAVTNRGGAAPKELTYLNVLVSGLHHGTLTDQALTELDARVKNEILTGTEPTSEDLKALEERLLARSEQIQQGGGA